MTPPEKALDRVRRVCFELEGTTEKISWGEPTFRAKGRCYAMFAGSKNHHGAGRNAIWCYAPAGAQQQLVAAAPERIFVPPYVGKAGWIGMWLAPWGMMNWLFIYFRRIGRSGRSDGGP